MARLNKKQPRKIEEEETFMALKTTIIAALGLFRLYFFVTLNFTGPHPSLSASPNVHKKQIDCINRLVRGNENDCMEQLRLTRHTFLRLCCLVRSVGLGDSRNICVEERVAIFLYILAHHTKQRCTKFEFYQSSGTVSRHFNAVLQSVLRLHGMLLAKPLPVADDETDSRWCWFKNCLGALDGTYVPVYPPTADRLRYKTWKGDIATNVLGVATRDLQFVYVLSGWEGSATDSRILQNALARPTGLKVPHGQYYLVDAGYPNRPGFLAPYRGHRYHVNIWRQGYIPTSKEEYFNMKHSSARNCVERAFGVLKMRWAILRSPSYYPIRTQGRIVTACCLIHNLIKREMPNDPFESEYMMWEQDNIHNVDNNNDHIIAVDNTTEWHTGRDALATSMFKHWLANGDGHVDNV